MRTKTSVRVPLRPCFSCGGSPRAIVEIGPAFTFGAIACQRCGARTTPGLTYEQAWDEWNAFGEQPAPAGP